MSSIRNAFNNVFIILLLCYYLEINSCQANKKLKNSMESSKNEFKLDKFFDEKYIFAEIIHNAIYFGLSSEQMKDYSEFSLLMKIKIMVHNSIFIQILMGISISFVIVLAAKSKINLWSDDLPKQKIEEIIDKDAQNINYNNFEEVPENVIKLEDFKIEEFLKRIKN